MVETDRDQSTTKQSLIRYEGTDKEYVVIQEPYRSTTIKRKGRTIWHIKHAYHNRSTHPDGFWIDEEAESIEWGIPNGRQWQESKNALNPARAVRFRYLSKKGFYEPEKPTLDDWVDVAKKLGRYRKSATYISMRCPSHDPNGKNLNMSAYPDRFSWAHCHACGRRWTIDELRSEAE